MMDTLFENYKMLLAKVDARCREIGDTLSDHMVCRKGCSRCCQNISLFPVEALRLRLALDTLDESEQQAIRESASKADADSACPLLDEEGACRLYAYRPVICRTHGLPILFEDEAGEKRVDFCPDNFTSLGSLTGEMILDIDTLNRMLTGINAAFCEELFDGEPPFERIAISDAIHLEFS